MSTNDLGHLTVTHTSLPSGAAAQAEVARQLAELARNADGLSSPTRHVILETSLGILARFDDAQAAAERVA